MYLSNNEKLVLYPLRLVALHPENAEATVKEFTINVTETDRREIEAWANHALGSNGFSDPGFE